MPPDTRHNEDPRATEEGRDRPKKNLRGLLSSLAVIGMFLIHINVTVSPFKAISTGTEVLVLEADMYSAVHRLAAGRDERSLVWRFATPAAEDLWPFCALVCAYGDAFSLRGLLVE